jgi:hypothetical protein
VPLRQVHLEGLTGYEVCENQKFPITER